MYLALTLSDPMDRSLPGSFVHGIYRQEYWGWLPLPSTNLDSILKSRDVTLLTNCLVKAMVFPVAMYGCESWTPKKAER